LIAPKDAAQETSLALTRPVLLTGSHILLAEDNRINVRLATQVLQKLGATWDVAEDGGKAIDLLRQHSYDLVLLDLHMPVMDGFDVIRVIRDPNGGTQNPKVPVLALTADAFEETRLRTLEAGMDDFLPKPFRLVDLADRASRLIQKGMRRPRV
jgi:CheY-like chemotaxis protein